MAHLFATLVGAAAMAAALSRIASPTEVGVPVVVDGDNTIDVAGCTVWVDEDRVLIAVSGVDDEGEDTVAWIFMGPA